MSRRMPPEEKPYRLYRGGRVKGKVPSVEPKRTGPRLPRYQKASMLQSLLQARLQWN